MSELRERMIHEMQMRGFAPRTHQTYLGVVRALAKYYRIPPDQLTIPHLDRYFEHLVTERHLSPSSVYLQLNALRFFYIEVLKWPDMALNVAMPKKKQRIPALLTRAQVSALIGACDKPLERMMLLVCYGCGLRLGELVSLKVSDIDSERGTLRVCQGKGAKDRLVPLGKTLIGQLRAYWCMFRPDDWLFAGRDPGTHVCQTRIQKTFTALKKRVGITQAGGIHSLRHAYATHQLEAGMSIHRLQRAMGHTSIHTTMRYIHWLPSDQNTRGDQDLVARLEVGLESGHE